MREPVFFFFASLKNGNEGEGIGTISPRSKIEMKETYGNEGRGTGTFSLI